MLDSQDSEIPFGDQVRHVLRPKNLLKTVASQVPIASACVEMLNQLDGQRMDARFASLEADADLLKRLHLDSALTSALAAPSPAPASAKDRSAWPPAVKEYLARNVEFAVVHTPGEESGDKYVLGVGNGCLIGDNYVLTCGKVLDTAHAVAKHKRGRVFLLIGLVWYEFDTAPVNESTDLVLCRVTTRNEETYQKALQLFDNSPRLLPSPDIEEPSWTRMPQIGQEIGFIVPSDGKDSRLFTEFTPVEFCTSVVAHFKRSTDDRILAFATSPVTGRIKQLGAPVFSIDAVLLGIISDVEKCKFDSGRRAVVTALSGFPRFTPLKQKPSEASAS